MDDANANVDIPNEPAGERLSDQISGSPARQIGRFSRTEHLRLWVVTLTPIITAVSTAIVAILSR